jgi:hypothetical protein
MVKILPTILWRQIFFFYNVHKTSPTDATLDQLHPFHILTYSFFKEKIKLPICLIKHLAKKIDGGVEV